MENNKLNKNRIDSNIGENGYVKLDSHIYTQPSLGIKKKQHLDDLVYNDEKLKNIKLKIQSFKNEDFTSMNLPKNKDLIPGQYEGGIKIWECALDLCKFLPGYIGWYELTDLKVLELGCGHGLPGIYFLLRNAKVLFQDFNGEVLEKITKNYILDLCEKYNLDIDKNAAYLDGDWKDFSNKLEINDFECESENTKITLSKNKFDIIISADTIYNMDSYESIYSILKDKLNNPGICFICSKKFYFGVGGGTSQFIDFITKKGDFEIKIAHEINDGKSNIRQIIEIRNQK